jgi:antitoxin VapB
MAHRTKLFRNGRSQAVRLPKEYAFSGDSVFVKKIDGVVMIFPQEDPWKPFLESLDKFSPDFLSEDRYQPMAEHRGELA